MQKTRLLCISGSYKDAAINAEIIYNIQALLSEKDLERVVDSTSKNTQIQDSYGANDYLEKLLGCAERRFSKEKIGELRKKVKKT